MNFKPGYLTLFCSALLFAPMWVAAQTVTGFTVVNADNNGSAIQTFNADAGTIVLGATPKPKINVVANTTGNVGRVEFKLTGSGINRSHVENDAPYALWGNTGPNTYEKWDANFGVYEITATPYSKNNVKGTPKTLKLTVDKEEAVALSISGFSVLDAVTGNVLATYNENGTYLRSAGQKITIRANTSADVESVVFAKEGPDRVENDEPYTLTSSSVGGKNFADVVNGTHIISAQAWAKNGGQGDKGKTKTLTLEIKDAGAPTNPGIVVDQNSLTFNSQLIGTEATRDIKVTNTGQTALVLSSASLSGTNSTDFKLRGSCDSGRNLLKGESCNLIVAFTPLGSSGARNATLNIKSNVNTVSIQLSGTAAAAPAPAPKASADVTSLSFDDTVVGGSNSQTKSVKLSNTGNAVLNLTALTSSNPVFSIITTQGACNAGISLEAGKSCTAVVSFKPTASINNTGTLVFTHNGTPNSITINLSGQGVRPEASATPNVLNFNQALNSTSGTKTVTITNIGSASLNLSSISISGTHASDFTLQSTGTCRTTNSIAQKKNCTVEISFTPSGMGDRSAKLVVIHDAAVSSSEVVLSGIGSESQAAVNNRATCAASLTSFKDIEDSILTSCATCHSPSGNANSTSLVFSSGADSVGNYNIVKAYIDAKGGANLLQKSIGVPYHGGMAPYESSTSYSYKALDAAIKKMSAASCTEVVLKSINEAAKASTELYKNNRQGALKRAAVIFAGRYPTVDEIADSDTDKGLRDVIIKYMTSPGFDAFIDNVGELQFLTRRINPLDPDSGINVGELGKVAQSKFLSDVMMMSPPNEDARKFIESLKKQPTELMKYIVKSDKPFTDILAARYTVVDKYIQKYVDVRSLGGSEIPPITGENIFIPAKLSSRVGAWEREHAGVLSTYGWLASFPTAPLNRNRARTHHMMMQFMGTDIKDGGSPGAADSDEISSVPTVNKQECSGCHSVMDPIAAGFMNFNENNRWRPNVVNGNITALPAGYTSDKYPKASDGSSFYQSGDKWFRDLHAPGYKGFSMPRYENNNGNPKALEWLSEKMIEDKKSFALGAVHFWYYGMTGHKPLATKNLAWQIQSKEFNRIADRFIESGFKVKELLADLVLSNWLSAAKIADLTTESNVNKLEFITAGGLLKMPSLMLNVKLKNTGICGNLAGCNFFPDPYADDGLTWGGFDGIKALNQGQNYSAAMHETINRIAFSLSCKIVKNEAANPSIRKLLPAEIKTPSAQNEAHIKNNIANLMKVLLGDYSSNSVEVNRVYNQIFEGVYNNASVAFPTECDGVTSSSANTQKALRSWAAVGGYMLGHYKFLYINGD